jgi:hypothetical protein
METLKIKIADKNGQIIDQFVSEEDRGTTTNRAIDRGLKLVHAFAVYVNGDLDCKTENLRGHAIPKTI